MKYCTDWIMINNDYQIKNTSDDLLAICGRFSNNDYYWIIKEIALLKARQIGFQFNGVYAGREKTLKIAMLKSEEVLWRCGWQILPAKLINLI